MLDVAQETARRKELFHQYVNSEKYLKTLVERLRVNDACNKHAEARALAWQLCARPENPAEGCIFFIEHFGWTFDPRPQADPFNLPFILYDYQKEAIRALFDHIDNGKDMLFEKSRDMGASWLIFCYVPLWYWLFRDGSNFLLGSYKEEIVDNRTKDSLFGLIDYAIDNLPKWLLPKGFNKEKHRNHRKLLNPVNFNQITGDTMSPDFGRGARKTAILFDELGFWEYAKEAWESASQSAACRIANSTPQGYNFFAMLRDGKFGAIDIHTMKWNQHPLKDQLWYEFEKARSSPEAIAQELDISYTKSLEGRVYPEWDEKHMVHGHYPYDPELALYVGWDFGRTDDTAIIWAQITRENKLRIIDTYKKAGKHIEFFVPFITGMVSMDLYGKYTYLDDEMRMIEEHRQWRPATHFGDPAGRFVHQSSDMTVMEVLKTNGVVVNARDEWKVFQKRKAATKLLLMQGVELHKNPRSEYFNHCITQAAYPRIRRDGQHEIKNVQPMHNWTSHFRSSLEYLALGLTDYNQRREKPFDKIKPKSTFNRLRSVGY